MAQGKVGLGDLRGLLLKPLVVVIADGLEPVQPRLVLGAQPVGELLRELLSNAFPKVIEDGPG